MQYLLLALVQVAQPRGALLGSLVAVEPRPYEPGVSSMSPAPLGLV